MDELEEYKMPADKITIDKVVAGFKKDWYVYMICALILLLCVFTIARTRYIVTNCNNHWIDTMKEAGCYPGDQSGVYGVPLNFSYEGATNTGG